MKSSSEQTAPSAPRQATPSGSVGAPGAGSSRRPAVRWLLIAALALVLLCLAPWLALRSDGFRRTVLQRVSERLAGETGLELTADDWRFGLISGVLTVERPSLRAGAGSG